MVINNIVCNKHKYVIIWPSNFKMQYPGGRVSGRSVICFSNSGVAGSNQTLRETCITDATVSSRTTRLYCTYRDCTQT